ncbi:hypothetical protein GCM10010428_48660 [Actinosynnema pretiosum subsp. pretiosum]
MSERDDECGDRVPAETRRSRDAHPDTRHRCSPPAITAVIAGTRHPRPGWRRKTNGWDLEHQ